MEAGAAPAGAMTPAEWAQLDLHEIRNRAERLGTKMKELGQSVRLDDFDIIKQLGTGANAFAYLARCKAGGQLGAHVDTLVAIKVLLRYRQQAHAGGTLSATTSGIERVFMAEVEKECRGPGFEEYRFNVVHVLGSFIDDALSLDEYKALDADFMNPRTAFIVTPFFCGGDLQDMIKKGRDIPESTVLSILTQVIDAVGKLQRHNRAHRDLKPDNVFFCGDNESLALADFGEVGDLRLDFKKGETSPGGAPDYLAPEIVAQISSMADGATAEIDYAKNDIYAIGMIAYKMCMHNMDATPWPDGTVPSVDTLRRIPADAYSEQLRAFIERGLLSPDPTQRMSYQEAQRESMAVSFGGGGQGAAAVVPQQQAEPEPEQRPGSPLVGLRDLMAQWGGAEAAFLEGGANPARLPAAAAPAAEPVALAPRWEWCGDDGQWQEYSATLSSALEVAYQTGQRHVDIDSDNYADPKKMLQKCWDGGSRKPIRRLAEGVPPG